MIALFVLIACDPASPIDPSTAVRVDGCSPTNVHVLEDICKISVPDGTVCYVIYDNDIPGGMWCRDAPRGATEEIPGIPIELEIPNAPCAAESSDPARPSVLQGRASAGVAPGFCDRQEPHGPVHRAR